jgi:hypothetical protein
MFVPIGFYADSGGGGGGPAGSSADLAITYVRNTGTYTAWTVLGSPYYYIWYKCDKLTGDTLYYQANNGIAGSLDIYSDAGVTLFSSNNLTGQYSSSFTLPTGNMTVYVKLTRPPANAGSAIDIRIGP